MPAKIFPTFPLMTQAIARMFDITGRFGSNHLRSLERQASFGRLIDSANLKNDFVKAFNRVRSNDASRK